MADDTHPEPLTWVRAAPDDEEGPGPWIEIAFGPADTVHLRTTDDPDNVVTTTHVKWEAFVLGVRAGEFDHFVEGVGGAGGADNPGHPPS
ncbi:DUF397 domain-containing protein [Streptomyces lasiicapitis]|uniref:DUF397 domain-containing protein n=1 Tax=Streptomyces lasiicapitis TaxID=1923961 RepID=A0ABQ2M2W8_9ACTN|nr:DUF397 domain-containing protein [Streptomyces lasiicapitis]GGO46499.1 hypothetical protein GCM10012286_37510 [Streptomyces lasiicapitis]